MKFRRIGTIKTISENERANQISFGYTRNEGVMSSLDWLRVRKNRFKIGFITNWLFNIQKNIPKIVFKVLTAISCSLKVLDRFNSSSLGGLLHF